MTCQQEQREYGQQDAQRQAGRIEKYVEEQDIHNDRADERETERGEASAQQQQPAGDLKTFHGVEIMAGEQGPHEFPGQFPPGWRQRDEVEEGVQTEHNEDEAQQSPGDDGDDFHLIYVVFVFVWWWEQNGWVQMRMNTSSFGKRTLGALEYLSTGRR